MKFRFQILPYMVLTAALTAGPLRAETPEATAASNRTIFPEEIRDPSHKFVGPWGQLHSRELLIEAPSWCVAGSPGMTNWSEGTVWEFPDSLEEVRNLLTESGLDSSDIERLTTPPALESRSAPVRIRPPESIIFKLSQTSRANLYSRISPEDDMSPFSHPIQLSPGGIPRMAVSYPGLDKRIVDSITALSYQRRTGILYFSDVNYVLGLARDDAQRIRILQLLTRELSEHAWISLEESDSYRRSDMLSYWDAAGKNPGASRMLTASWDNPDIKKLELVHLLPPGPKRLLNTYPSQEESLGTLYPDCIATAFSFFSDGIPPNLLDTRDTELLAKYERAKPPWQLGDVILVTNDKGDWIHVCNYVAGELVFTKNGGSPERPWVLQILDDVFATYLTEDRMSATFFRLKPAFAE